MKKNIEDMTADELRVDMIARRARKELDESGYRELYSVYCAKRKAEIQAKTRVRSEPNKEKRG